MTEVPFWITSLFNNRLQKGKVQFQRFVTPFPANIRLDEDVLKTPWRRLSSLSSEDVLKTSSSRQIYSPYSYVFRRRLKDVFRLCLQKTSWRHLHQDKYIHLIHTSSEDVLKTSSRRLDQDHYTRLGHTSSRRLQDVFRTSYRRLHDVF